jgi:hypothetical protein
LTALFFGDWMTAENDAKDLVYDILTPYYWEDSQSGSRLPVLELIMGWAIEGYP